MSLNSFFNWCINYEFDTPSESAFFAFGFHPGIISTVSWPSLQVYGCLVRPKGQVLLYIENDSTQSKRSTVWVRPQTGHLISTGVWISSVRGAPPPHGSADYRSPLFHYSELSTSQEPVGLNHHSVLNI